MRGLALMSSRLAGKNPSSFWTLFWKRPNDSGFWLICEAHIDPFWEVSTVQFIGSWPLLVSFKDLSKFSVIPDDERNDASVTLFISTLSFGDLEPVVLALTSEKQKRSVSVDLWMVQIVDDGAIMAHARYSGHGIDLG